MIVDDRSSNQRYKILQTRILYNSKSPKSASLAISRFLRVAPYANIKKVRSSNVGTRKSLYVDEKRRATWSGPTLSGVCVSSFPSVHAWREDWRLMNH